MNMEGIMLSQIARERQRSMVEYTFYTIRLRETEQSGGSQRHRLGGWRDVGGRVQSSKGVM